MVVLKARLASQRIQSLQPLSFPAGQRVLGRVGQRLAELQSDMSSAVSAPEQGSFALLAQNAPGNIWNPQGAYQIVGGIVAGTTYNLSSYYLIDSSSGNTGTYGTPFAEQINFGNLVGGTWTTVGTSTATFGFGNASPSDGAAPILNNWYLETGSLVAPVGASEAEVYMFFMDNGQTTTDQMYIDNASLVAAPEPTTLALAGLGGAAALSLIRRRKS